MKLTKLICFAVIALFTMSLAGAQKMDKMQGHKMAGSKMSQKMSKGNMYACTACEMASMKAGKCPMCGAKMEKVNAKVVYACADCHTTSNKMGKCSKCGKKMEKMAMTYACEACHKTSMKAGKCPMCKADMKQTFMKMAPSKKK